MKPVCWGLGCHVICFDGITFFICSGHCWLSPFLLAISPLNMLDCPSGQDLHFYLLFWYLPLAVFFGLPSRCRLLPVADSCPLLCNDSCNVCYDIVVSILLKIKSIVETIVLSFFFTTFMSSYCITVLNCKFTVNYWLLIALLLQLKHNKLLFKLQLITIFIQLCTVKLQ